MEASSSSRAVAKESASCIAEDVTDLFWTDDDCDGYFDTNPDAAFESATPLLGVEYSSIETPALLPVGVEMSIFTQAGKAVDECWVA